MSATAAGSARVLALGIATGARTFVGPAALALRGRLGDGRAAEVARFALPALALGEMGADKLPTAPGRVELPGLLGRVASGTFSGHVLGGGRGARLGAACALASTYPTQALRAAIVTRTSLPDLACALPEDLIAAAASLAAGGDDGRGPSDGEASKREEVEALSVLPRGAVAALVGAGAMSSARECVAASAGDSVDPRVRIAGAAAVGIAAAAVAYEALSA